MSTYTPPIRARKAEPILYRLSDALGLRRTAWPKPVRDDLDADIEARAALVVARAIHEAGEAEVEAWLARKAEHDREQASGDPLAFEPWSEPAPDVEGLRAMLKAYAERQRRAARRAASAYGDAGVSRKLVELWADHGLAEVSPDMTVGDAAAVEARAEVARDLIAQAMYAHAAAAGGSDIIARRLRRRIREAGEQGLPLPTVEDIEAEMYGKTPEQVEADRKRAEERRAKDAARKREARLAARARTGRTEEPAEVGA